MKDVFILPCEMQHTYTCYEQRRFCHVSLNFMSQTFKWTSYKVWKCMDQRSALYQMFQLSAAGPKCICRHWSIIWSMTVGSTQQLDKRCVQQVMVVLSPVIVSSTFGDGSFAVAGTRICNSLPSSLRSTDLSTERFKRPLKTYRGATVTFCLRRARGHTYNHHSDVASLNSSKSRT